MKLVSCASSKQLAQTDGLLTRAHPGHAANQRVRTHENGARGGPSGRAPRPAPLRQEFRAWRASLPTALERDTLLMPEAIAESVVTEACRYLDAELPADFAERLAAKAHYLYPRHKHFRETLNRPGNRGRDNLYMFMRHWTCSWLKRERPALYKKLPWSYAQGRALPITSRPQTTAGQSVHALRKAGPSTP